MGIDLLKLAEILNTEENLTVTQTDEGLLIRDVNEQKVVPSDITNFVSLYEKENNIQITGTGYVITTTTFSGQTFMLLLLSVFGAEYDFKVTGAYEVTATKKGTEGVREDLDEKTDKVNEVITDSEKEALKDKKEKCYDDCKVDDFKAKQKAQKESLDFEQLAEDIDSPELGIEIHEDGLKIVCANKTAIAEKIDSLNPTLNIEITNDFVLVSE